MPLNRDDFPDLTDAQWDALSTAHDAEVDRARTQASTTAREKARQGYVSQAEVDAKVQAALEAEQERAKMDAKQLLDADREAFETERKDFAKERRQHTAKTKLTEGGIPADKVDSLLPLFAGVDDKVLDTTIDTLVTTHKEAVKAQVDAEKVALLGGATPPASSTVAPTDAEAAAYKLATDGDVAGAADALLRQAGLVT
jgi:hypothetical protein